MQEIDRREGNYEDKNRSEKHKYGLWSSSLIRITHTGDPGYDEFTAMAGTDHLFCVNHLLSGLSLFALGIQWFENNYLLPKLDQFASFDQAWPRTLKGRWEERRWVELNPPQIIAFFVVNLSRCVMISVWALSKSGLLQARRQREESREECGYFI